MAEQTPSIGRIVHYVSYGTPGGEYLRQCRAAIITEVGPDGDEHRRVGLCVLNPTGQFFNQGVRYDDGDQPPDGVLTPLCGNFVRDGGTWHWPERV